MSTSEGEEQIREKRAQGALKEGKLRARKEAAKTFLTNSNNVSRILKKESVYVQYRERHVNALQTAHTPITIRGGFHGAISGIIVLNMPIPLSSIYSLSWEKPLESSPNASGTIQ